VSGDYLWDGSGPVDPEVRDLEQALAPLRHRGAAPSFEALSAPSAPSRSRTARPTASRWSAVAAIVALVGVLVAVERSSDRDAGRPSADWGIAAVDGRPRIAHDVIETDEDSRARIDVGAIGTVLVQPASRVRLIARRTPTYRLDLERGALRAFIWAPPGKFLVDTPSARAVDLGCAYTLAVDGQGLTILTVESGWVALAHDGREAFVPAGARCQTRGDGTPGLPYYLDAAAPFRTAVAAYDAGSPGSPALATILGQARPRDAVTLWHLLGRTTADDRGRVFDVLVRLVPPPDGVTREAVLAGDRQATDRWWDALGLGSVDFWRKWKADWTAALR
jgi:hypothetical protein